MRGIALELLSYKVNDLLYRRPTEGGVRAVLALHDYLQEQRRELASAQLSQLDALSASLLRYVESPAPPSTAAHKASERFTEPTTEQSTPQDKAFDAIFLDASETPDPALGLLEFSESSLPSAYLTALPAAYLQERQALRKMAERVWWHHLRDRFYTLAVMYRQEPERYTVRILYTTLRNLNSYLQEDTFLIDRSLEQFSVLEPVPDYRDPLLSLNDTESITELLLEVARTVMEFQARRSPYRHLQIPRHEVLNYVQKMASLVAKDPYQGRLTLSEQPGASAAQIRLAIQELSREGLRPGVLREQTSLLQERLQEVVRFEKSQRRMFDKDVQHYSEAVADFFTRLRSILPTEVGGDGDPPQPFANVLFAEDPLLTTGQLAPHAEAITIKLNAPFRFTLAGISLGLVRSEQSLNLYIDGQGRPIFNDTVIYHTQRVSEAGNSAALSSVDRRISIFLEGEMVHLEVSPLPRSLNRLIAEAMTVNYMMLASQRDWISQAMRCITGIPSSASTQFARRALRALLQECLASQRPQHYLKGMVLAAMRITQVSPDKEAVSEFLRLANLALSADARQLSELIVGVDIKDTALFDLQEQHTISFQYEGVALGVKRYEKPDSHYGEHMVVINLGRVLGAFEEFMLQPLKAGMVLLARSQRQLATLYVPFAPEDRLEPGEIWG